MHKIIRKIKYCYQCLTRGWSDRDTWSLDNTIAKFVLPRLKRFKDLNIGFPCTHSWEEWNKVLDDMIYAMEIVSDDVLNYTADEKVDWNRVNNGLELFGKHFRDLWW